MPQIEDSDKSLKLTRRVPLSNASLSRRDTVEERSNRGLNLIWSRGSIVVLINAFQKQNNLSKSIMTLVATGTSNRAASLVGKAGEGLWGQTNPQWYACVVKADNEDGTIKVQWDDRKKFTFRLPVEKFRLTKEPDEDPMGTPFDVLFKDKDGDY